jgi:hypothetical protein
MLFATLAVVPVHADQTTFVDTRQIGPNTARHSRVWRDPDTTGSITSVDADTVPLDLLPEDPVRVRRACSTRTWLVPSGREVRVHAC